MTTERWVKGFRFRAVQLRLTLLKHTYAPGDGVRWVLQTSTSLDRKDRQGRSPVASHGLSGGGIASELRTGPSSDGATKGSSSLAAAPSPDEEIASAVRGSKASAIRNGLL